jgi:hypothetical protein
LSFKLLEKYLDVVVDADFVQIETSSYELTDEGRVFLKLYRNFQEKYAKVQELLETLGSEYEKLARLCKRPGLAGSVELIADEE